MNEKDIHIEYSIHYNWPPGKDSFSRLKIDKISVERGVGAVVMAKEKEDAKAFTFTEFVKGPLPPAKIMKIISDGAKKGQYLIGKIFIIEIYNKNRKCIGKTKINANQKRPSEASGDTSVNQEYLIDFSHNGKS